MKEKLLIVVACFNRPTHTRHCLETLAASKAPQDILCCFDDGSTEYHAGFLGSFAELNFNTNRRIGIHAQRILHFQFAGEMMGKIPEITRLYLTDNDTIHDPHWRDNLVQVQDEYDGALVCGYDTLSHSTLPGNTWRDDPGERVIWRKYAPGVSYLLTADHVTVVNGRRNMLQAGWDWIVPDLLGNCCAITRQGWLDHIGFGGDRHPSDDGPEGGDRVANPTAWLQRKRAEVIAELKHDATRTKAD